MAKRKEVNIEPWESQTEDAAPEAVAPRVHEMQVGEIVVGIPAVTEVVVGDYCSRHVEVNLTQSQAKMLQRITKAMDVRGERLNNGKRVITKVDTIRRVLELVEGANG